MLLPLVVARNLRRIWQNEKTESKIMEVLKCLAIYPRQVRPERRAPPRLP
jgi:hypothetical protein